jgi:hypothetical protein
MATDKQQELDHYYRKGGQDLKDGVNHPPRDSLVDSFRIFDDATIAEVEKAYDAGRSDAGRKK